jgi:two-component system, NtrC family, response regulator AtoC
MDKAYNSESSIDMMSLVNSHEKPFVVIDREYRIIAVNSAYEKTYGFSNENAVGKMCYQVSHGNDHPCNLDGEICPHQHVFDTGEPCVCAHIHCDQNHRIHQVKVMAYPLRGANGELYMGECIEEVSSHDNLLSDGVRMVGSTPVFLACIKQLDIAASSDAPVLLQGETGTGKELAAEYIHKHSSRSDKPFQIVDSTVLTENLFESEMFGHVSGAYTGSVGAKQGLFELAEGGTIFLDEIGDLPITQQAKMLRVLETGQYRHVGGKKTHKANVRIICATNRHLWESVLAGRFREDLYYRIACLNIRLPCLRERREDVPVLARNLMEGINRSTRSSYQLTPDAFDELVKYNYPGNVRELRNILFIAATHSINRNINGELVDNIIRNLPNCRDKDATHRHDSHAETKMNHEPMGASLSIPSGHEPSSLRDLEAEHIRHLLKRYDGSRKRVADALGISERTIYRKLNKLGLN